MMTHFDPLKPRHGQKFDMSAVDILKATQQGTVPVRCGCRLWCTMWGAHIGATWL